MVRVHLKLPQGLADKITPSGLRSSKEQEACLLVQAAVQAAKETKDTGILPVLPAEKYHFGKRSANMHIRMADLTLEYIDVIAREENCSRGEVIRRFLELGLKVRAGLPENATFKSLVQAFVSQALAQAAE